MMPKRSRLLAKFILGMGVSIAAASPHLLATSSADAASAKTYRQLKWFGEAFDEVRTGHVDGPEESKIIEAAIAGMLASLDPDASFIGPQHFRDMAPTHGTRHGTIGVWITMEGGAIKVIASEDDSPAAKAGLRANDLITQIDGEPVEVLNSYAATQRFTGASGSAIRLTISRPDTKEPFEVALVRTVIDTKPVRWRVEGETGYIRVALFDERTLDALKVAVETLSIEIGKDKLNGYVIDLRNNPGGLFEQGKATADAFLERGEIVVTHGRTAAYPKRFSAETGDLAKGKPIVVLVNAGTASAAEIVAGALQDHRRATILGTRSFGKGSEYSVVPFGGRGALRLKTGLYHTPSGRLIEGKGIEPDQEVIQGRPESLKGSAVASNASGYVPADPREDRQLIAAFEFLRAIRPSAASRAKPTTAN